jgi:NAD(P)H-flavin reductase
MATANLIIAIACYFLVFYIINLPCWSTRCLAQYNAELQRIWIATGIYLAIMGIISTTRQKLPFKYQVKLQKPIFRLSNFTGLDLVCLVMTAALLLFNFNTIWWTVRAKLDADPEKTAKWQSFAIEFRTAMFAFAHVCDALLALTLLPVSRQSVLPFLRLAPADGLKYHKLMGNLLVCFVLLHSISYCLFQFRNPGFSFYKDILLIGKLPTYKAFNVPFGIGCLFVIILVRLTSLEYIRRTSYDVFLKFHKLLLGPCLVLAFVHAASNFYWTFPSLILYIVDSIYSRVSVSQTHDCVVSKLECGLILMEIYPKNDLVCHGGQFFMITIPEISTVAHPFSVAYNENHLGFLMKPSLNVDKWSGKLMALVSDGGESHSAVLKARIDGPLGVCPFEGNSIDCFVAFVGGSGISAALLLIQEHLKDGAKCFLFWATKDQSFQQIQYFQELVAKKHKNLFVKVFETGESCNVSESGSTEYTPLLNMNNQVCSGRMVPLVELESLYESEVLSEDRVGVYTCGPRTLMSDVEQACSQYANIMTFQESFEW